MLFLKRFKPLFAWLAGAYGAYLIITLGVAMATKSFPGPSLWPIILILPSKIYAYFFFGNGWNSWGIFSVLIIAALSLWLWDKFRK